MTISERRAIFESIRNVARGERTIDGRDEVPSGRRIRLAGMDGRALEVTACELDHGGQRRIELRTATGGEVVMAMSPRGEMIFPYGDLAITTPDRRSGAAFAEAMASWLGAPLARAPFDLELPPGIVDGGYVRLGTQRDADGVDWEILKLFVGHEEHAAECFLRLDRAGSRGAFTEKWSRYREGLLVTFDRTLGASRELEARKEVFGVPMAWLSVPLDWTVSCRNGHAKLGDPDQDVLLELSSAQVPRLAGSPSAAERLQTVLALSEQAPAVLHEGDRGDLELAWAEVLHLADDPAHVPKRQRPTCTRWLLALCDVGQVLATYKFWLDDATWAVPEWERIVSTLRIG